MHPTPASFHPKVSSKQHSTSRKQERKIISNLQRRDWDKLYVETVVTKAFKTRLCCKT